MNRYRKLQSVTTLVLITLLLSACGGPAFTGRLIIRVWGVGDPKEGIYELLTDSGRVSAVQIAPEAKTAISPDEHYLIYVPTEELAYDLVLRDLQTGEERTLIGSTDECFSWSVDSTKFAFVSGSSGQYGLHTYDLSTDTFEFVFEKPSATYQTGSYEATKYGEVTCGTWIGPDHLLFQAYSGALPFQVDFNAADIPANATFLAVFKDGTTLSDTPERLSVLDISADTSSILVDKSGITYLAQPFRDFGEMNLRVFTPCPECYLVGFVPDGNEVYFVKRGNDNSQRIYFANPETLETRSGPALNENWEWNGIWVGDPKEGLIALVDKSGKQGESIVIFDLNTEKKKVIFRLGQYAFTEILAWLP